MEKEKLESLLIEYIDGTLSVSEKTEVEKMLFEEEAVNQLYKELKEVMTTMNEAEDLEPLANHKFIFAENLKKVSRKSGVIFFRSVAYRAAAAIALVMIGLAGGYWLNSKNQNDNELAALRKEMAETKQMMLAMMNNDQSASQRMQGVNVALSISKADDEIVNILTNIMLTDPNTNVRLAALEALSNFIHEPKVKLLLTSSLSKQDDPVVQISLIQLLVQIKEKNVVKDLEKIIENDKNIQAVKDEAYSGILKLS